MATDDQEALWLLREAEMVRMRERSSLKSDAATALLAQLLALDGKYGMAVKQRFADDPHELVVQILGATKNDVTYTREHGVRVGFDPGIEVLLDFDRETRRFVGRELDTYRTPVPGQPIPRRSALAVLVESIISVGRIQR